jgi:hypothetical protein
MRSVELVRQEESTCILKSGGGVVFGIVCLQTGTFSINSDAADGSCSNPFGSSENVTCRKDGLCIYSSFYRICKCYVLAIS